MLRKPRKQRSNSTELAKVYKQLATDTEHCRVERPRSPRFDAEIATLSYAARQNTPRAASTVLGIDGELKLAREAALKEAGFSH